MSKTLRTQAVGRWQSGAARLLTAEGAAPLQKPRPISQIGRCSYTTHTVRQRDSFIPETSKQRPLATPALGLDVSARSTQSRYPTYAGRAGSSAAYSTGTGAEATSVPEPTIHDVFEPITGTWQYVVADPSTLSAVVIDPVLDYDPATQVISTESADALLGLIRDRGYRVGAILETHAHADHLTASSYIQGRLAKAQGEKPPIGIGKRIDQVQQLFSKRYGIPKEEYEGVFDKLFEDNEHIAVGNLDVEAIHLPGHTPDHLGYRIGDNIFCGDSIFTTDIGTARCDFPGGSAASLWASARKLLGLPDRVKIWTGHDYPPLERQHPVSCQTVEEHKAHNKHIGEGLTEQDFVKMRQDRDRGLAAPRLLHQSLQMNIRAGRLPKATASGDRMLHLPFKLQGVEPW